MAAGFASAFRAGRAGRFVGRVHDLGKAAFAWQQRLMVVAETGERVGIDHKSLGVEVASARLGPTGALVVQGHHGGLSAVIALRTWLEGLDQKSPSGASLRKDARAALASVMPEILEDGQPSLVPDWLDVRDPLAVEFFTRMLFSTLVDADVLDTRSHAYALDRPEVRPLADMGGLFERFSKRRASFLRDRPASAADAIRHEVYESCLARAIDPPGLYRLPAPTGAGKTLASMGFALRHAAEHGKRRVIVAVPFTTITEQNAAVYRQLLEVEDGEPVVLEHHSNAVVDEQGSKVEWARHAAENWDAPVVVTTTAQLFESLFGRRPGKSRKVHRLAEAVIVLDEVQALPHGLLPVICDGLRRLAEDYGTTVLLASATQPAVQELTSLRDVPVVDVLPDPVRIYGELRRVRYEWWLDPRPSLDEVAAVAAAENSALVVVNTIADARQMFGALSDRADRRAMVRHLSTAMCPAHRRGVLAEVLRALSTGVSVLLATTQLVEAGVDIDFPVVYRALAPADSLQQAAGRANREGLLGREGGRCVVFDPSDGGAPPSYRTAVGVTRKIFGSGRAEPDNVDSLRAYYTELYEELQVEGPRSRAEEIKQARQALDFVSVETKFRMIEDDTFPVVVPYGDDAAREQVSFALSRLRASAARHEPPQIRALRALQPYIVSLRRRTRERSDVDALCASVIGDLAEWRGGYDQYIGIETDVRDEDFLV